MPAPLMVNHSSCSLMMIYFAPRHKLTLLLQKLNLPAITSPKLTLLLLKKLILPVIKKSQKLLW